MENKEISVQAGMIIDGVEESIPFGNYIIEKPDTKELEEHTSFTGYDYMIKFNVPYQNRAIYPITAGKLLEDLCAQVGLEAGSTSFVNSNYLILGNPFTNNENCRTVLSNIAQLAGGFARIGRDNKVYIVNLKQVSNLLKVKDVNEMTVKELNATIVKLLSGEKYSSDEALDGNNYLDNFAKNDEWGELNSLILSLSGEQGENTVIQDDTSIAKNGLTELTIEDNYFLINQEEREKAIKPLWENLKGLKYLPFKVDYYGYPYLDAGDIVYIQDTKDTGYISYVFNHTFTFNGAYSGTLETEAMTKTQTAYKNTINSKTKFRRVERKIDKINGIIESIIEEQTDFSNKLTNTRQDIDGITEEVHRLYDFYKEQEGTNEIILDDCLPTSIVELRIKPKNINSEILYPSAEIFPSNTVYPRKAGDGVTVVFGARSRVVSGEMIYPSNSKYPTSDLIPIGDSSTRKFQFYFGEPLRSFNDVSDEFHIIFNEETGICEAKVIRKLDYNDGVYTIYQTPKEEIIEEITMELFQGTNYVYLEEYTDWNIYAKYIFNNELNKEFAPRVESKSEVRKTADEINLEVSKKVNQDEVIASINLSPEQIKILAKNLQLEGFTSINGNFTIDEDGNMTCNDAKINGAVIANGEKFSVDESGNVTCNNAVMNNATMNNTTMKKVTCEDIEITSGRINMILDDTTAEVQSFTLYDKHNNIYLEFSGHGFEIYGNINGAWTRNAVSVGLSTNGTGGYVDCEGTMHAWTFEQTSEKEKKKYIKKTNKKAVDLIKNSDICQYQLKGEKATGHRHFGLVIGENYNCPDEVKAESGKGIELYSMISLAWKAIQELSEENKILKEKIEGGI